MTTTTQTSQTRRTHEYLIYRHGSNSANQSCCDCAPVAIVTAASREEACRTETLTAQTPARLVLDPTVSVWSNQHLSAVPRSRASAVDWNSALEIEEQRQSDATAEKADNDRAIAALERHYSKVSSWL